VADPLEILNPDEVDELRAIWYADLPNYWHAIQQIADEHDVEARHVSEEVWRGTEKHARFWGTHRPKR